MGIPFDPDSEYRVGSHAEDDDEDFSDIWDTRTLGRPKKRKVDPERVWGTKEYFRRVDNNPRDEWDTGLKDFPGMTQRIKRQVKADAERIRNDVRRASLKVKADAERVRIDARRAAEKVRSTSQLLSSNTLNARKESLKRYDFTTPSRIKKTKRRFKLSGKSGGIGIVGILFWGFVFFNMCSDDDSDKTAKVVDTTTSSEVVERVKTGVENLKPEVQSLIDKAKSEYERVIVSDGKTTKTHEKEKPSNVNDPYKQSDDRYGSVEDKW